MDADTAKRLREKFDVKHIGLKPKFTCQACSKAPSKVCGEHKKVRCDPAPKGCGQWITERHMHVEFVGHANVTDRLLEVDPGWTWEPMAFGSDGLPVLDANGGLWIRLTVAGVTRIGYGGADGKRGEDAVKEAIGDAIKVAAMRFGVGLDLWRKEEASGKPSDDAPPQQARNGTPQQPPARPAQSKAAREALEELDELCKAMGYDVARVEALFAERHKGANVRNAVTAEHAEMVREFTAALDEQDPTRIKAPVAANGASS